jgi:hypothetical protein
MKCVLEQNVLHLLIDCPCVQGTALVLLVHCQAIVMVYTECILLGVVCVVGLERQDTSGKISIWTRRGVSPVLGQPWWR